MELFRFLRLHAIGLLISRHLFLQVVGRILLQE